MVLVRNAKARKGQAELPGGLEDLDNTDLDPSPPGESVAGVFDELRELQMNAVIMKRRRTMTWLMPLRNPRRSG